MRRPAPTGREDDSAGGRPASVGDPLVSVIVPVHDAEEYVAATLRSIVAQTHTRWECVVVDDGSRDASVARALEVVRDEPRMRLVRQPNAGVSAARNTGLQHLSPATEYVAFVDSDDQWCPDALRDLLAALEGDPSAVGAFGLAELLDSAGRQVAHGVHGRRQRDRRRLRGHHLQAVPAGAPLTFAEAVVVSPVYPPAVALHRRAVVDRVGAFDERLGQLEDWEWYLRALRHGHLVALDTQVAWYRVHGGQLTGDVEQNVYFADRVRRQVWSSDENTAVQRRAVARAWRQVHARRTLRSAQRLVRAVHQQRWRRASALALGTAAMLLQVALPGPPPASRRLVRWTGRTV